MMISRKKSVAWLVAALALPVALLVSTMTQSSLQAQNDADPGKNVRCATRLSVSLLGTSPSAALQSNADPLSQVDGILADPLFQERFARYINSINNDAPGANTDEDAAYHLSKYILQNGKPWKELYSGAYNLVGAGNGAARTISIQADPNGLGYFRNQAWLQRYAGNELTGLKLNTAYRLMNNVVGLELTATTNAPGADVSATGRQAAACRSCHYDGWYALDKVSSILSRVQRQGQNVTFIPSDGQAREVLDGLMLKDDKELVSAMVDSEQFVVNSCRTAFKYVYGRGENSCEAELFDRCVEALKTSGMIQAALATIVKDPSFCQ